VKIVKAENLRLGLIWQNHSQQFPKKKRRRLTNAKPTKEYLGDINAYRFELESDTALAETAEIT
jgi:hypothetical protein